eukprot:gene1870-2201_t
MKADGANDHLHLRVRRVKKRNGRGARDAKGEMPQEEMARLFRKVIKSKLEKLQAGGVSGLGLLVYVWVASEAVVNLRGGPGLCVHHMLPCGTSAYHSTRDG